MINITSCTTCSTSGWPPVGIWCTSGWSMSPHVSDVFSGSKALGMIRYHMVFTATCSTSSSNCYVMCYFQLYCMRCTILILLFRPYHPDGLPTRKSSRSSSGLFHETDMKPGSTDRRHAVSPSRFKYKTVKPAVSWCITSGSGESSGGSRCS